ncbi:MAG: hypothetical protein KKC51_08130 [Verrucomicrobia bacterium]|nr:hypothetical protein [Verrucomicrobiota bacterium]
MMRVPAFPAGTLLEISATGFHPARRFEVKLRTLDAPGRAGAPYRFLVLPPGAPEHGLPEGRIGILRFERGSARRALRVRQAALCQKLIRRAASVELGAESAVADVYGTFFDPKLGWIGSLGEWIEGRFWRMEIDDRLFDRPRPASQPERDDPARFRTEYDAKRLFMARWVSLLHRLGAARLARRYEWSTWISQRKVLKRAGFDDDPHAGWTATDFKGARLTSDAGLPAPEADPGSVAVHRPASIPVRVKPGGRGWFRRLRDKTALSFHMLFRPELRNARLMEEVQDGLNVGMLTPEDAERIRGQVHNPMLQTYLTCLAVHLAMLPLTNLTVLAGAVWYSWTRDLSLTEGARLAALGLAFFAVAPMSPGSLMRGLFVLGVVLRRRSIKGLRIALAFSFWRYIGYMAFPLQMVSAFPALARYLAARWATHAVRLVPVFGKPGGLLEHRMFDLTFNVPLTLARRWRRSRI